MQSKSAHWWPNLLLAACLLLLSYGIQRLFAVDPMPTFWIAIIAAGTFVAGLLSCSILVNFRHKSDVAVLATTIVFSFAAGSYVLQLTGRNLIDIVDAKLVRPLGAARALPQKSLSLIAGFAANWQSPRPPDNRTPQEIADRLKEIGFTFSANYNPVFFQEFIETKLLTPPLPLGPPSKSFGGPGSITLGCSEGDQRDFPIFTKDRYGFDNDDTVYAYKELYMLIGGSFAGGSCVHQDETIQGQLRRNGFPTFTTGIGMKGAIEGLADLTEYGETYRPKAVLWQFYDPNDIVILRDRELHSSFLLQYLRDGFTQDLVHRQAELDAIWQRGEWAAASEKFKNAPDLQAVWEGRLKANLPMVQQLLGRDIGSLTEDDDLLRIYQGIFEIAERRVAAWGGRIYLIMIPNQDVYVQGAIPKYQRRVEGIMARLGITTVDVDQAIRAAGGDSQRFFAKPNSWSHFNAAGYRLMSEQIMNMLGRDFPAANAESRTGSASH